MKKHNEVLEWVDLEYILDNCFPEDFCYYSAEVEECREMPVDSNLDRWYVVKVGMFLETEKPELGDKINRDELYDTYCRVVQGDFGSPKFSDNPIRIVDDHIVDGHHRIISAWIAGVDKVPAVVEEYDECDYIEYQ